MTGGGVVKGRLEDFQKNNELGGGRRPFLYHFQWLFIQLSLTLCSTPVGLNPNSFFILDFSTELSSSWCDVVGQLAQRECVGRQ